MEILRANIMPGNLNCVVITYDDNTQVNSQARTISSQLMKLPIADLRLVFTSRMEAVPSKEMSKQDMADILELTFGHEWLDGERPEQPTGEWDDGTGLGRMEGPGTELAQEYTRWRANPWKNPTPNHVSEQNIEALKKHSG